MSIRELAIRNLVAESYSQDELREFCHKHFDAVLCEFGQGASIKEMAMTLVEYCARRERLDFLLDRLKEDRPEKYEKYQKELELPAEVFGPLRRAEQEGRMPRSREPAPAGGEHFLSLDLPEVRRWFLQDLDLEQQVFVVTAALFSGLERQELMTVYRDMLKILQPAPAATGKEATDA